MPPTAYAHAAFGSGRSAQPAARGHAGQKNLRLGIVYRQLQKMHGPQLDALREHAASLRTRLAAL